jgi:hypothetical protein
MWEYYAEVVEMLGEKHRSNPAHPSTSGTSRLRVPAALPQAGMVDDKIAANLMNPWNNSRFRSSEWKISGRNDPSPRFIC